MRISLIRPAALILTVLGALAPHAVLAGEIYSRRIQVGCSLYLGLKRDQVQKGTVTVKTLDGKEVGKLDFAGSFVPIEAKGTYTLEFSPASFDLNFAIIKSKTSTGAFFLNVSRDGSKTLKAKGNWDGDRDCNVTLNIQEKELLIAVE